MGKQSNIKDVFILWKGDEKRISLQDDGVKAVIHFKPGYCNKPFKIPGKLWPVFKKKLSDALTTGKMIVCDEKGEPIKKKEPIFIQPDTGNLDPKELDLEKELNEIPEPELDDTPEYRQPVSVNMKKEKDK